MPRVLSTTPPYTVCQSCKAGILPIVDERTLAYFRGESISCPKCGVTIDWWDQILAQIKWAFPSFSLAPAGAHDTWLTITMKPGERFAVDLSQCGVPPEAKILQIQFTAQDKGLLPVDLFGNSPQRRTHSHKLYLYGAPMGEAATQVEVLVTVLWVPQSQNGESWSNLVMAFEAFANKVYESTIIPANVSVESKLNRILSDWLSKYASSQRVDIFLETAATYSHQLNILLPLISTTLKIPQLPDHIRGILNKLRKVRNRLAHNGKLDNPTTEEEAAEYLCACFFTFICLRQLQQRAGEAA